MPCADAQAAFRRTGSSPSIRTRLVRPDAPLLMETADLRQRKWPATRASSSAFALPSTGGALSWASQVPSSACVRRLAREPGLTLIVMTIARAAAGMAGSGRALAQAQRHEDA